MSSISQQQKDSQSSNSSTQPSMSSAASGSNNCAKSEDRASQGRKPRGPRPAAKRRSQDVGQKQQPHQRQLIRYDRDALLQMRDSRLSSAWPRALDKAYVGDGGLWDPVKLFEGERKISVFEGKTKIERVRNVRGTTIQPYSSGQSNEDSNSFGRSSRRRTGRTKEEAASPATSSMSRQRGWPSAEVGAQPTRPESEKENKKELLPPPRFGGSGGGGGFGRRMERPPPAARGEPSGGPSGQWERSQNLRDQQGGRGFQAQRHRAGDEEELPAWFDEGPLDKMEKLELTGLPEDVDVAEGDSGSSQRQPQNAPISQQQQHQQQSVSGLGQGGSVGRPASSRFAKWLAFDEPQPKQQEAKTEQRSGAQQQLERIFQDMRDREGSDAQSQQQRQQKQQQESSASNVGPSLMHLLRPPQPPASQAPQRPMHAQEVEANLKSLLFGSASTAPRASSAASSGGSTIPVLPQNGQARTLEEIESSLGAEVSDRGSRGSKDCRAIYKLIGDLQVQMHDAAGAPAGGRQSSVPPLVPASARHSQQQQQLQQQQQQQQPQPQPQQQQPQPQPQQQPQPPPQKPQHKPLQATAAPFVAQNPLPPRLQPQQQHQQQQQQPTSLPAASPMFSTGASPAAAAAAQRRLPMPLQAQQLQQLQAMLLSNLQMQAQMMHNGQLSGNSSNKTHPLSKLLPQQLFYRPPNPYLQLRNNALQGTRLLNQHFNQANPADFSGFDAAGATEAASAAGAAYRRPTAAAASQPTSSVCPPQPPIAQPAMPIVPPMLMTSKASSAAAAAASAGHQSWGGAHNQQLSAMLWNATKLAASVKSTNPSAGWGLHRDPTVGAGAAQQQQQSHAKPVDEMPSA